MIRTILLGAAALLAAGCATPQLDTQWSEPGATASALRGARVLVACAAVDPALERICADRLAMELQQRGAVPVMSPEIVPAAPGEPLPDIRLLDVARASGARALVSATVGLDDRHVSRGVSLGIGGFGIGTGRVRAGIGVSVPVGGGRVTKGYALSARLLDTQSGRMTWTARASAPPSSDLNAQMARLAETVVQAADKAGVF